MQTFLPFPDFKRSAQVLDSARLGKQRVENLQIMCALTAPGAGWAQVLPLPACREDHPAVKMWKGYERALMYYQTAICDEWTNRGYADTCWIKTCDLLMAWPPYDASTPHNAMPPMPPWLGDEAFHRAHQSNLRRKSPVFYALVFPDVPTDLEYVWPVS